MISEEVFWVDEVVFGVGEVVFGAREEVIMVEGLLIAMALRLIV